jgi:probable F420-dependent oxidoreductase
MTKLGLNVRNFGPAAAPDHFRAWARFAEDNGFALATISDHVALAPEVAAIYPEPFYEPFTALTWMAAATSRLELATSVAILPVRDPLVTARMAVNLDQLSGGRFVLGVGVGWSRQEYAAVGVPFAERGRILDEHLAALTAALSGEVVSFSGRYVSYADVSIGPRPSGLRLWVGGASSGAIQRAATFADAWHPINAEVAWVRDTGLPALRAAASRLDRPVPAFAPRIRARLLSVDLDEAHRTVGIGSLRQILADIEALTELGASYVILDTNADRPEDQPPLEHDFATLRTLAEHYHRRA